MSPGAPWPMNAIRVTSAGGDRVARETAFRIRYRGYRSAGHIESTPDGLFRDAFDDQPGSETLLAHIDETPVGTIRILRRPSGEALDKLPAAQVFRRELESELGLQSSAIEVNRFALEPALQTIGSFRVKLALLKAVLATCCTEDVRYCVAAARDEHLRFYTEFLHMRLLGAPVLYPGLRFKTSLLVGDLSAGLEKIGRTLPALVPGAGALRHWAAHRHLVA